MGGEISSLVWVFLPLLQHLLLSFFFFFFSFFFFKFLFDYLYEFVYGFDEFGSRFRKILMILWCVRVVVVVVGGIGEHRLGHAGHRQFGAALDFLVSGRHGNHIFGVSKRKKAARRLLFSR